MSETDGDAPEAIEPPSGTPPAADGADRSTGWGTQGPWSTPPAGEAPSGGSQPPPGYGYGYGYGSGYGYASPPPFAKPANNLVSAILATVLCCLPLGIVAIINSSKVNGLWASGQFAAAQKASADAKKFAMWGAIIGAIVGVIYLIVSVATGMSAYS